MKKIVKIVVTGGPCAGKTSALNEIQRHFKNKGVEVLVISETATGLILGGVTPFTLNSQFKFQVAVFPIQIAKENAVFDAAKSIVASDKVLVVCDRGVMDGKVYLNNPNDFDKILAMNNITEQQILERYDAVFHLVTAADGAGESYTLLNNPARTETLDEAILADKRNIQVWSKHPNFEVIDNSMNFEKKLQRLLLQIEKLF